ncbi:MAG: hypothetical protein CL878_14155 [Dehalococcoidia bacterium]|nr:hypothetical protein [Dehalococcoidia bacterium]
MSLSATVLVLLSAVLHATWNLVSKRQQPSAAFYLVASAAAGLLCLPLLGASWANLARLLPTAGLLLGVAGLCQGLYFVALAGAYRQGDLSVVYPLARAVPTILVLVVTVLRPGDSAISAVSGVGALLAVTGCLLVPAKRFRDLGPRTYGNRSSLLAVVAAVGIAGYSVADAEALARLRLEAGLSPTTSALLYLGCEALSTAAVLAVWVLSQRQERWHLRQVAVKSAGHAALTGVVMYVSYGLVLAALAFAQDVSYVVAFRQVSIPLGALFGLVILGEPWHRPKLAGVGAICVGLVLVSMG